MCFRIIRQFIQNYKTLKTLKIRCMYVSIWVYMYLYGNVCALTNNYILLTNVCYHLFK